MIVETKLSNDRSLDEKAWLKILAKYRTPHAGRSVFKLTVTAIPFAAFWMLTWLAVHFGFWWGLILIVPAAGFLLRLFMIQHDCGHGSFFARRRFDDWTGRVLGVLTLTPYDYWRRAHATYHASAGNLDERGVGDITTLTVTEYYGRSRWGRIGYRLYRHPLVMFGIGPAWLFLFQQRLPIVLLAGSIGVWLFYVQHQFEKTHWSKEPEWQFPKAALHGASHYDLPRPLRWLTGNIGIHHVHHLSSKIPYYRLPEVLRNHPELGEIGRITLWQSLQCVKLVLWDEGSRRLVSFREAAAIALITRAY